MSKIKNMKQAGQSAEDYLEAILILNRKMGNIRSIDLAEYMDFSRPSISRAVNELKKKNHLIIDEEGHLFLTESGMKIASKIYERHCVITEMLTKLGVNQNQAELDACEIEHVISEETFEKMKELCKTMQQ